ncbi:MAG TPA: hypothetical protein VIS48_03595, partial [Candidatus Kryptonia bacterium]
RAVSSEGYGRIKYFTEVLRLLHTDEQFRRYFEQETTEIPKFYTDIIRKDLGSLWDWLPPGAMYHDPNAYLKDENSRAISSPASEPVLVPVGNGTEGRQAGLKHLTANRRSY